MSYRYRRQPDGRGPFPVEGGEPYIEPEMTIQRQEPPMARAKAFGFGREIPEYDPMFEVQKAEFEERGLSQYFQETRTPVEVTLAREDTERLKGEWQTRRDIEMTRLSLISQLAASPLGGANVQQALSALSPTASGSNVLRQYYRAPQETRANVARDLDMFKQLSESDQQSLLEQKKVQVESVTPRGTRQFVTTKGELVEEIQPRRYLRRVPAGRYRKTGQV